MTGVRDRIVLLLDRLPDGVRHFLNSLKLWATILLAAIVAIVVWLVMLTSSVARTEASQAADRAVAAERVRSNANAVYQQCLGSIVPLKKISTHLRGVNDLAAAASDLTDTLLVNSGAAVAATPRSDPYYKQRAGNLTRLERAAAKFRAAAAKIAAVEELPVPTKKDCRDRRQGALDR